MRLRNSLFTLSVLWLGITVAASGDQVSWTFQQIDSGVNVGSLALSMRTGATWPTVLYDKSNQLYASSLTPAGWLKTSLGSLPAGTPSNVRSAAGNTGPVGAAWLNDGAVMYAASAAGGWQTTNLGMANGTAFPGSAPDIDYLSGNRQVVAYGDNDGVQVAAYDGRTWVRDTVSVVGQPPPASCVSVAVDSQDRIMLAYRGNNSGVQFAQQNPSTGSWAGATVNTNFGGGTLSLALSPLDEPGLVIVEGPKLSYASFDRQSGQWLTELIDTDASSISVDLAFDSQGNAAMAYYSDTDSRIHYRIKRNGAWDDFILPIGTDLDSNLVTTPAMPVNDVALAFDADDLPVIAYRNDADELLLAYDPLVAPEPASLLLIAIGGAWMIRRK